MNRDPATCRGTLPGARRGGIEGDSSAGRNLQAALKQREELDTAVRGRMRRVIQTRSGPARSLAYAAKQAWEDDLHRVAVTLLAQADKGPPISDDELAMMTAAEVDDETYVAW